MSSSPMRTPSPTLPGSGHESRFVITGYPCEWAELYRPGGFHPVEIGETLDSGRYRVIRKLGYGSFSLVWLAVDTQASKYVALKMMMSKHSADESTETELGLWQKLQATTAVDDPNSHVLRLLKSFVQEGPNGTHRCMVYEPMGGTVASMLSKIPPFRHQVRNMFVKWRYPKAMVKQILRHALMGLVTLHSQGIVHGDIQPGNMLFTVEGLNDVDEARLTHNLERQSQPLVRADGRRDKWSPRYRALPQPLYEYVDFDKPVEIKLSDLGAAFYRSAPPAKIVTPLALRAPEIILQQPVDEKIDIWSFGCQIYELLTATQLFVVMQILDISDEDADDDHMSELNDVLGPIPSDLMAKWPRASQYFGPNGERLNLVDNQGEDDDFEEVPSEPLEAQFEKNKPDDIGAEEAQQITRLIRRILKYDPAERPSAEELLNDKWLNSVA